MPDKPRRRKGFPRVRGHAHQILYACYLGLIVVVFVNLVFPSAVIPVISLNYWSPESYNWAVTIPPGPPANIFSFVNTTTTITVNVTASQPLADGVRINIYALGCEKATGATGNATFTTLTVGFDGAYSASDPNSGSTFNGETLLAFSGLQPVNGWANHCPAGWTHMFGYARGDLRSTVFFKNPGTYPLILRGNFWGNTTYFDYVYSGNTITVQPSADLDSHARGFAEQVAVVTGFAFAITDGRKIIDFLQKPPS